MWQKWLKKLSAYFERLDSPSSAESRAFLWLWSLSFYLNYAESWSSPALTFCILGVCVSTFFIKKLQWAWGLYLAFSTAVLAFKFPILANHSIFNLFVNFYLLYLLSRKRLVTLDAMGARALLLALCVVYFWAGIHKLNTDFLFSDESCAHSFMGRINITYFNGWLPPFVTHNSFTPILVVLLEVLIALLLLKRRSFYVGLALAMGFHMVLAALEFIDFSMNSLSILVLALGSMAASRRGAFKNILNWVPLYVIAQFFAGLISFFEGRGGKGTWGYFFQNIFFVVFTLWILYHGVKVSFEVKKIKPLRTPLGVYFFPALIFIFGSFNYLGLSTAGTFSMFSNLQTEGDKWNHVLIPKALRVMGYQDKVYWVNDLPNGFPRANREHPREGMGMPEIEFYRVIQFWKKEELNPPGFEYELNGEVHRSDKISEENIFHGRTYSWLEQKLFFFRRIQKEGPNKCRW